MENNTSFYYFYWQHDKENIIRYNHHVLLLSITLLLSVYPAAKIKIVVYKEVPKGFDIFENFDNVEIIHLSKSYIDIQQENNRLLNIGHKNNHDSPYLLSKPLDCFKIAKDKNEKMILLDLDFFVFSAFENLDFSKVGFVYWNNTPNTGVNTGLIACDTDSFASEYFFDLCWFLQIF
jgi:hypothetical protein